MEGKLLLISFLVIIWWIGMWGFIETIVQHYIKGSFTKSLLIYGGLIIFVGIFFYTNPNLLDHFI